MMFTPKYIYSLIVGFVFLSLVAFAQQELKINVVENSESSLKIEAVGGIPPYKWVISGESFQAKELSGNKISIPNVGKGDIVIILHDGNKQMKYLVLNR